MANDHTFLGRLARDVRGNTLAIMAAAMIPMLGFAGSAIDFARIYVVKVRLQQACDAGVLAGRKAMTDTSMSTPLDTEAKKQADAFFKNNFPKDWQQTSNLVFTPKKTSDSSSSTSANIVEAKASVTVPMAVMYFFGVKTRDLETTCQARFDLADTDVMFVLDTTGSMSCVPNAAATCANGVIGYTRADGTSGYYNQESGGSKIDGVRKAVKLFDDTMRSNADPTTHFRYGFVTYSSGVNVGKIIPAQYLQNTSWDYQTRRVQGDYNYGNATSVTATNVRQEDCIVKRSPASGYVRVTTPTETYYGAANWTAPAWTAGSGGTCKYTSQPLRALWRYNKWPVDVSQYIGGGDVANPSRIDGVLSRWRGCIEEVNTTAVGSFDVNNLPDDLDPDFKPSDPTNKWRPMWPDVEWWRASTVNYVDVKDENVNEGNPTGYEDYSYRADYALDKSGSGACGMPAYRLKVWSAADVSAYVNNVDFKPFGGTYHDVGMIWGTRMLSPDGVFGDDTKAWPGRNEPSRNIVFMTDGQMSPNQTSYGLYGVEQWDKRIDGSSPSDALDTDRHNARFRVECDAAKKKGMTVYVVALGVAINSDLQYCASPGQTFQASSTQALTDAFKSIAQRVASLRITQ